MPCFYSESLPGHVKDICWPNLYPNHSPLFKSLVWPHLLLGVTVDQLLCVLLNVTRLTAAHLFAGVFALAEKDRGGQLTNCSSGLCSLAAEGSELNWFSMTATRISYTLSYKKVSPICPIYIYTLLTIRDIGILWETKWISYIQCLFHFREFWDREAIVLGW